MRQTGKPLQLLYLLFLLMALMCDVAASNISGPARKDIMKGAYYRQKYSDTLLVSPSQRLLWRNAHPQ